MLQAKMKNGQLITLIHLSKKEVEEIKSRGEEFYCPECSQPVLVKSGIKVISHFAHFAEKNCSLAENGEGAYHESGKIQLYNWLKKQRYEVQLEAFIPSIVQRPDILLTLYDKKIAIEYQCAQVPIEIIQNRNRGYLNAGIIPIWILGANKFIRISQNRFKLTPFLTQFLHQFSSSYPLLLLYFCPITSQFVKIQNIILTGSGQAFGSLSVKKLYHSAFPSLFSVDNYHEALTYRYWKREKEAFRQNVRGKLYGEELAWHKWLYERGTHYEYLPSSIHLPVKDQYRMKLPPWNWQSRLLMDILHPLSKGHVFSIHKAKYSLKKYYSPSVHFPLIHSHGEPILQYLHLLERLGYLTSISDTHFRKQMIFPFYTNVEEAVKGDRRLLEVLESKI
ncbi:hypothetical protein D8M04_09355 [Oceanobacillus piezotolerans]|uniref:Competence protein CoiA n=1 Tax=Oceanobacillus piezotolerans TaxID=2448030 RepID=A0A498D6J5_9BACI|nr:competence protein CoiA family protein [Oceanobacillus piezotolerans]RLL45066.1 hypothetical protein D8M04_09355 [Oceanobacillus piezotolerans]